jgi:hypothetical protein
MCLSGQTASWQSLPTCLSTHPACELVVLQLQAVQVVNDVISADDIWQAAAQQIA